jgi:hypothetical protein
MSGTETREPQRSLGVLDTTRVGMGAMIGAGIFVLTGLAAQIAGLARAAVSSVFDAELRALDSLPDDLTVARTRVAEGAPVGGGRWRR